MWLESAPLLCSVANFEGRQEAKKPCKLFFSGLYSEVEVYVEWLWNRLRERKAMAWLGWNGERAKAGANSFLKGKGSLE